MGQVEEGLDVGGAYVEQGFVKNSHRRSFVHLPHSPSLFSLAYLFAEPHYPNAWTG